MTKLLIAGFLFTLTFFVFVHPARATIFYLSPDNISIAKGASFSVQVKLDGQGDVVNGVSAYLAFPKDKLEVRDIWDNEEALPIEAEQTVEGNVIKISRANLSSLSGDIRIATINFKAKDSGNALIAFIPGSVAPRTIDSSDSLNLNLSRGAVVKINDLDNSSGPGPNSSSSPGKLSRCESKLEANKNRLTDILNSLTQGQTRLDTIYALVDDYYSGILAPGGKTSAGYIAQRLLVDAKRSQTIVLTLKLKTDISAFSCILTSPKNALVQIEKESQAAKSTLQDYKDSVRKLIGTLI